MTIAVTSAAAEHIEKVFPYCSSSQKVCFVNDNVGGNMHMFAAAAAEIRARGIKIVVGSDCASACASVVDLLRKQVDICLQPSATFLFHKGTFWQYAIADGTRRAVGHFDPPQTPQVARWIKSQGGLPLSNRRSDMLTMRVEQATRFWRMCSATDF